MLKHSEVRQIAEIECDKCSYGEEYEGNWIECIRNAKNDGWIIGSTAKGEWGHICQDCNDQIPRNQK